VNSTRAEGVGREQRDLNAYHDGELSGLRCWIFERRLACSPRLRAELEELKRVSQWVQELDPQSPRVNVWDDVALRLPAIDATREDQREGRDEWQEPRAWLGMDWLAAYSRPIAAVAVAAALALALFLGIMEDAAPPMPGMIRWLDTGGRSVIVLEDQGDATIVWLLEAPEAGASEGGLREAV
jgi:anti-sigma factor RsiW